MIPPYIKVLVGVIELLDQAISHWEGGGLVGVEFLEVEASQAQGVLNVVHDLLLDRSAVSPEIGTHEVPELLSGADSLLLLGRVGEFRLYKSLISKSEMF